MDDALLESIDALSQLIRSPREGRGREAEVWSAEWQTAKTQTVAREKKKKKSSRIFGRQKGCRSQMTLAMTGSMKKFSSIDCQTFTGSLY